MLIPNEPPSAQLSPQCNPSNEDPIPFSKPFLRFDLAAHVTNQCSRRPVCCKYCFSPFAYIDMEKHVKTRHFNNKNNDNIIDDDDENIAGTSNSASWKSGRKCSFGCQGRWHSPESLKKHKTDASQQHLERLNRRIVRLEITNESTMKKENEENGMNMPMVRSQQQPSNLPWENDSEMENMDATGPEMSQQTSQQVELLGAC